MKFRYFYAPAVYNTWAKLYVLTSDGVLYSQYLVYMRLTIDKQQFDFETFKASDYSFEGYQDLKEIDYDTAIHIGLTRQANWIEGYLQKRLGILK